jgi:Immunity protein 50
MFDMGLELIHDVPGADDLLKWFGKWPSFHDAEVLGIELNRKGASCLRIHTWEMTKEIDAKGYYVNRKHVVVSFFLENLKDVELAGFSSQNVVFGLTLTRVVGGFQLSLDPSYGVAGTLTAEKIRIEIQPGAPPK